MKGITTRVRWPGLGDRGQREVDPDFGPSANVEQRSVLGARQ
jgi:hypothetical protein